MAGAGAGGDEAILGEVSGGCCRVSRWLIRERECDANILEAERCGERWKRHARLCCESREVTEDCGLGHSREPACEEGGSSTA